MSAADVVPFQCPNCGASLPTPAGRDAQNIVCKYCEHGFLYDPVAAAQSRAAAAPAKAPPMQVSNVGIAFGLLFVIGGITAAVFMIAHSGRRTRGAGGGDPAKRMLWDSVAGPPVLATIAGQDAVCGRMRATGAGDVLSIQCFDATTLAPRWVFDNLGAYSGPENAYRKVHVAVAEHIAVVSDDRDQIHLLDVETGQEKAKLAATDAVERLCVTGPHTVFALVSDKHNMTVNVASFAAGEEPKAPKICESPGIDRDHLDGPGPTPAGFARLHVWIANDVGVAGGYKVPGTGTPMAIGFDPKTQAVRWTVQLGANAPAAVRERSNDKDVLVGDVYYSIYGAGSKGWHVAAYDAKTGAPLWDTALRVVFAVDSISDIVASASSVYVVRTSSLDILDAKTGKLRGTIGDESYADQFGK